MSAESIMALIILNYGIYAINQCRVQAIIVCYNFGHQVQFIFRQINRLWLLFLKIYACIERF